MSTLPLNPVIRDLDPVTLPELKADASLQTRRDRKYVVPYAGINALLAEVADEACVLEIDGRRTFRYESNYFDTPGLNAYRAAAYRRPHRFKVRTRSYLDSGTCLLEFKHRNGRGLTVKEHMPYQLDDRSLLTRDALDFLGGFDRVAKVKEDLARTLTTRYDRTTLLETASHSRITIDTNLVCAHPSGAFTGIPGLAIVETKSAGPPSRFDHLLWRMHCRPVKISKYGTGLAAIDPSLPSNKWHRVLNRHFVTEIAQTTNLALEGQNNETHNDAFPYRIAAGGVPASRVRLRGLDHELARRV
ncbi:MAG: polyphosphate polymerase domain-containing protein [Coriobacteriia bacterium]|nr:polyphosphate polymerase domain-containing protein [Coriobacteriia bacterium]MBN2821652.1 polyphosphate polymerase domain-containing protein [Coriobacteriia bacterium]